MPVRINPHDEDGNYFNFTRGVEMVRRWCKRMGFGHWRITVKPVRKHLRGKEWGASYWNFDEEWAVIELVPDDALPAEVLEALVVHEIAHGLVGFSVLSDSHEETAVNRIVRIALGKDATHPNSHAFDAGELTDEDYKSSAKQWLGVVIDGLPPEEREVVSSLYIERATLKETAERIGKSSRTVGRIRKRALRRMRAALDEIATRPPEYWKQFTSGGAP